MGYEQEIGQLRDTINDIDKNLVAIFEERMQKAGLVAKTKQKYGKDVFDAKREEAVIARAVSLLEDSNLADETRSFFHALMDISKKSQQKAMMPPVADHVAFAQSPNVTVGYLGIKGSFSHIATTQAFGGAAQKNYNTFKGIMEGLKMGEIDYAMLPAENTETGSITAVVDLLAKYGYYIVGEKLLPVSHSLLGIDGAAIGDIKKVYTHPEVLSQCSAFLHQHEDITGLPSLSTAQAAVTVAGEQDKNVACIASKQAADIYGLTPIAEDIQNNDNNCTRFVIVAKQPFKGKTCDKTSIVLMLAHKPGSLYNMLRIFSDGGINVLKLESRPLKDRPFEYMFHIDFEGCIYDQHIKDTIELVKKASTGYIYLGCYPKENINV